MFPNENYVSQPTEWLISVCGDQVLRKEAEKFTPTHIYTEKHMNTDSFSHHRLSARFKTLPLTWH